MIPPNQYEQLAVEMSRLAVPQMVEELPVGLANCPDTSSSWTAIYNLSDIDPSIASVEMLNTHSAFRTYTATPPTGQTYKFYTYSERPTYLVRYNPGAGYLWGREGLVHSKCTLYLGGYREQYPTQTILPANVGHMRVVELTASNDVVLAAMPLFNPRNYFHWIAESLVRLVILLDELEVWRRLVTVHDLSFSLFLFLFPSLILAR